MDLRPNCGTCNCAMDMANIRANPDGAGFICRTCLEAKMGGKGSILPKSQAKDEVVFDKKSYLCEDCSYTFERNATFYVADCPMCAKTNIHEVFIEPEITLSEEPQEQDWLYE